MSRRGNAVLGWTAAIALAAAFAWLGSWQYGRADEKRQLLAEADRILQERDPAPLAAAADIDRADRLEWSAGRGRFIAAGPFLLDNQRHDGQLGVRAYRVFVPEGTAAGDSALLVDLGWLPMGPERAMPEVPLPEGTLEVRGLLAPPPSPGLRLGTGMASLDDGWLLTRVEQDAIAATAGLALPLAPRVLRLDPALPIGHARDLDVLPNTLPPERHVGYAVQWFGLSATVLLIALVLTWRGRRRAAKGTR